MILKQLNNSLEQLINEINDSKDYYYDNFINVSLDVEDQYIQIVIDDIWADAYRYQLSDYNPEWLAEATTKQITEELLKGAKKLYNDLNLLVKNSYTYIENNIDKILENIKECKDASDTFYLVLDVVDNKIMNYMSTATECTYTYEIFDTYDLYELEEIEERELTDDELKELILEKTKKRISEWEFILQNFENEE